MSEIRVLPLPKVTGLWDHDVSKYPDRVKVPMSDGQVVTYHIDVEMPHPCFEAAMVSLDRMAVGYQARHEKKVTAGRQSQRPQTKRFHNIISHQRSGSNESIIRHRSGDP